MMMTVVDDFFAKGCGRCDRFATPDCSTRRWVSGLARLRRICLSLPLVESVKWGHPCYMHAERNVAIVGAFREDFRLTFFHAGLMKDQKGVLEKQGPNTRFADMIRFTDNGQVVTLEETIVAYLQEAMAYAARGLVAAKDDRVLDLPEELADALDADPELADAFHALTPGRRKSYIIHLNGAKKSETRIQRIAKLRPHILAGKGALER